MINEKVEEILIKVRAGLKSEGGDIELVDIKNNVVYVKLNMAVSLTPHLFEMRCVTRFMGFFEYSLPAEGRQFQDIYAIINLTLRHPYATLLSDYPMDNHSSRIQGG